MGKNNKEETAKAKIKTSLEAARLIKDEPVAKEEIRSALVAKGEKVDEQEVQRQYDKWVGKVVKKYYSEWISYVDNKGYLKGRNGIKLFAPILGEGMQSTVRPGCRVKSRTLVREEYANVLGQLGMHLEGVPITVENHARHYALAMGDIERRGERWCRDKLQEFFDERGLFPTSKYGEANCAVLISKKIAKRGGDPDATALGEDVSMETREQRLEFIVGMYHKHGVFLLDQFTADNGHIIRIVELVHNVSPYQELHRRLTEKQKIKVGIQVADYLVFLEERGVMHRDIKPSNILVTKIGDEPFVKVADLGIIRMGAQIKDVTGTGELLGTIDYMSPEQAKHAAKVTSKSDVFALGTTLYHLITGNNPNPIDPSEGFVPRWLNAQRQDRKRPRLSPGSPVITPLEQVLACMLLPHDIDSRYSPSEAHEDLRALYNDEEPIHAPRVVRKSSYNREGYFSQVFSTEGEKLKREWSTMEKAGLIVVPTGILAAGAIYGPTLVRKLTELF